MAKWLLIDGFNLAYRCFYAVPELTRLDGFPTGALHGWVKSLWRLSDLCHYAESREGRGHDEDLVDDGCIIYELGRERHGRSCRGWWRS